MPISESFSLISHEQAFDIASTSLNTAPIKLVQQTRGWQSCVYRLETPSETLAFKASRPGNTNQDLTSEVWALRKAEALGARAPRVHYQGEFEVSGEKIPWMIASWLEGKPYHLIRLEDNVEVPAERGQRIFQQVGSDLALLHQASINGFGDLNHKSLDKNPAIATHPSMQQSFSHLIDKDLPYLEIHGLINLTEAQKVADTYIKMGDFVPKPVLSHRDLNLGHIVVDPSSFEYSGLIDFGRVGSEAREFDLAHFMVSGGANSRGLPHFESVLSGYGVSKDFAKSEIFLSLAIAESTRRAASLHENDMGMEHVQMNLEYLRNFLSEM
jgi:aminoglycoside phosphotransferase (APT) family kinase protein